MSSIFDDLKKFAISDILSVSGKDKTARVIENHMNNLIEVALIKGAASRQAEIDDLQKRFDEARMWCEKGCVLKAMEILKGDQS